MKKRKSGPIVLAGIGALFLIGAAAAIYFLFSGNGGTNTKERNGSYTPITQEDAMERMQRDDGHLILDVRRQEEYDAGHIPGAICIPNESITTSSRPERLPDTEQILLVYCRSGRRSKEAAQKLADLGYVNVYEFGGILTWKGEITMPKQETGITPTAMLCIQAGEKRFYAVPENNSSAQAFLEKISASPLEISLHDYGYFEKVGALPWSLPRNDTRFTTSPGDIVLYNGDQITIYYDENTWSFTRLARIGSIPKEELLEALGQGDVTVRFWVEWSE